MPTTQIEGRHSRLLAVETPTALGHTSTLTIIDSSSAPQRVDAALLRREVNARLDDHPMLRQSLVEVPLGLDRPYWRDHPGFDLDYHLRYIAVPDPDDPNSLADLVARIHSRPARSEPTALGAVSDHRPGRRTRGTAVQDAPGGAGRLDRQLAVRRPDRTVGRPARRRERRPEQLDATAGPVVARHRDSGLGQCDVQPAAHVPHGARGR